MKEDAHNLYQYEEEFRDTLATVDEKGKRVWVYPKKPAGYYHNLRIWVTVLLLTLFFAGPFLQWQGRPFLLFNIFERKFILFGQVFWPQDFFLLALTLIAFFVFIILFTVVFGRLWCGWACPQTLFMEMVFRKIEYWIEGDANAQRRLNNSPWTREKMLKKTAKQIIFVFISLVISHTTMAYLVGMDQVREIVSQPPTEHPAGFIGLIVFTGIFYGVFAWFREQACIAVCPYGRLQGVLLVKDSIVVAYDWLRGEPRGKLKKNQQTITARQGDCIDCKLCVHVCPTGIDIRNGTQLECVNCTACMDACDDVMTKISKPKGLIRYSSYSAISQGTQKLFTPRVAGYALVLTALTALLSYFVFTRADIETTILKVPGTLYTKTDDGQITNLYSIEFVNKTFNDIELSVKVESPAEATYMKIGDPDIVVPREGILKGMIMIKLPDEAITSAKTVIELGIYNRDERLETARAMFIGPIRLKNKSTETHKL
ncbi:MAG: cytochrome c oxidase accessory protein CcoG [Cyclobacteriaceae bacterium]|nr:cytochrome c oxidase accessory protein CcoG [Cyclobacteriaceae bacterium]